MQHSKVEANDDGKIGCAREILAYESLNNDILDDFQQIKMFLRKKRKYGIFIQLVSQMDLIIQHFMTRA